MAKTYETAFLMLSKIRRPSLTAWTIDVKSSCNSTKAEASRDGETTKVFIELRDDAKGYPGCTYNLTYDPESKLLQGEYFQAAMGTRDAVAFRHSE